MKKSYYLLRLLQNCLSSPNSSIPDRSNSGTDMVFQALRTIFPLRIPAGMTKWGLLQEPLLLALFLSAISVGFTGGTVYADAGGGQKIYDAKNCGSCHMTKGPNPDKTFEDKLKRKGPDLWFAGSKFKKDWLVKWLQDPKPIRQMAYNSVEKKNPGDHTQLPAKEAGDVTDYLMTLTSKDVAAGVIQPKNDLMGKMVFEKKQGCYGCHLSKRGAKVAGGMTGPSLVDAGKRLQGDWIYAYLKNPQAVIPVKRMPTYAGILTEGEIKSLAAYVSSF